MSDWGIVRDPDGVMHSNGYFLPKDHLMGERLLRHIAEKHWDVTQLALVIAQAWGEFGMEGRPIEEFAAELEKAQKERNHSIVWTKAFREWVGEKRMFVRLHEYDDFDKYLASIGGINEFPWKESAT